MVSIARPRASRGGLESAGPVRARSALAGAPALGSVSQMLKREQRMQDV